MSGDDRDAKEAAKQAYNFCERQNAHGLKMLFKKNAAARVDGFINGQGRNGLHTCSARGDLAVVKQILKSKRADVNTQDSGWNTAVMLAAETGRANVIRALVKAKAHINTRSNMGGTALMYAAHNGHAECLSILIEAKACVNAEGADFNTALMSASDKGMSACVKILLDSGADVDAQDAVGNSALIRACTVADYGCLCMLLKGGADVNARTVDGGTALLRACKHARVFSREHAERKVEVVSRLLEHKADVHARDHAGWTPVLHACEKGMRGLIKHLASEGADVNACVKDTGTAPIHMTAKAGHTDCVSVLIAHKAKVDAVDKQGRTALLHACANVNPLTVGMLLQHRANINAVAYNGDTGPLLLCKIGTRKALKLLHKMLHKTHTKGAPLAMVGPKTEEALLVYAVDLIQREKRQKEAVAHKIVAAIQGRQAIAAEDATTPNRPGIEAGEVDEAVVTTSVFSAAAVTVHVHDNELHQQSDIIPDTKCPQDDGIVITGQLDLSNGIALLNHLQPFLPRD